MDFEVSSISTIEGKVGKKNKDGTQKDEDGEGYKRQKNAEDSEGDYIDENGKRRAKRRSKNDLDGRDYKCSYCPKTYLSYPALYTHMKTKHSNGSDSQQLLLNSGRGRGRPKKNAGRVTTIAPDSEEYFKTLDKGGGPTDPLYYLESVIKEFFSSNSSANKAKFISKTEIKENIVKKESEEAKAEENKENIEVKEEVKTVVKTEDVNMTTEEQQKMSNDQTLNQPQVDNPEQKEDKEESKTEFQFLQKNFKQFDFRVYEDYKEYPLYKILNKTKLFEDGQSKGMKEVKEEPIIAAKLDSQEPKIQTDEEMKNIRGSIVEKKEIKIEENQPAEVNKEKVDQIEDEVKNSIKSEPKAENKSQSGSILRELEENNSVKDESNDKIIEKENEVKEEEGTYGKKRFDQVLEDYESLTFDERRQLS